MTNHKPKLTALAPRPRYGDHIGDGLPPDFIELFAASPGEPGDNPGSPKAAAREPEAAGRQLARLLAAIPQIPIGIAITTPQGIIEYFNPHLSAVTGFRAEEVIGTDLNAVRSFCGAASFQQARAALLAGNPWQGEVQISKKTGATFHALESIHPGLEPDGSITHFIHFVQDITEQKLAGTIHRLAFYDGLTSLPNRNLMLDRLSVAMATARRNQSSFALLCVDLDRFKEINDTQGHAAGDWLLQALANRLKASLRASDTLGRWGGDEFVAIIENAGRPAPLARIADKLLATGRRPYRIDGRDYYVTLSIGVSLYPQHAQDWEGLLNAADAAMYQAKAAGGNTCRILPPDYY